MSPSTSLIVILVLVASSAFFAVAEMAIASARRLRLQQLVDEGDVRAGQALQIQQNPGAYFTVVQIGQNMVAILAGIVGEDAFSPSIKAMLLPLMPQAWANGLAFFGSVLLVTGVFILFADLLPKRIALAEPERLALRVVGPMRLLTWLLRPAVALFNGLASVIVRAMGLPERRDDRVTSDDILALTEAGTQAGVLHEPERRAIENLIELDTRTVESTMTPRSRIVYLLEDEPEAGIRARIAARPHSTYVVCRGQVDRVLGYVDATDLFARVLTQQPIALHGEASVGLLRKVLMVPDRLTLSEMLMQFREAHEDFAVIVNEYSLVVGVITLNDVMSTVMGALVSPADEDQMVQRSDGSWLMDGHTPISDVVRALGLDAADLPQRGEYDTLAGFLMVKLRRIPRRTDATSWGGHRFEVIDVDSAKIDQVLVTVESQTT